MGYKPFFENFAAKKAAYFDRYLDSHGLHNSGFFYYPPLGYREWHTNAEDSNGWALYYIEVDRPARSWLYYVTKDRKTIRRVPDENGYYNLFRLNNTEPYFWHAVYSESAHRFSIGFMINETYAADIISRTSIS